MTNRDPLMGAAQGTQATPQTQPLPGRTDMVKNAAGGYVFQKDLWDDLRDFIIIGSAGGTYYVDEKTLTWDKVNVVTRAVAEDGERAVRLAVDLTTGRPPAAPRNQPALFILAWALVHGDQHTRGVAAALTHRVARTTYHKAAWFGYVKALHGVGGKFVTNRTIRDAISNMFQVDQVDDVTFTALKGLSRASGTGEKVALRDLVRLGHPAPDNQAQRTLYGWLVDKVSDDEARLVLPRLDDYLVARSVTNAREAIRVIDERKVPWEFLPDRVQSDPEVWSHLVDTVGVTALIRNLARLTRIGTLVPFGDATERLVARLTSGEELRKGRVHPMDLYLALRTYEAGRTTPRDGRQPVQVWTPVPAVVDALDLAWEKSFASQPVPDVKLLVAVDSSGSMTWYDAHLTNGTSLGPVYNVANSVAIMLARLGGNQRVHVINFDTNVHPSKVTAASQLRDAFQRQQGSGTDLSLPFTHALSGNLRVDGFVILTDGETWAGRRHATQALEEYRRRVNPNARVVVATMTPTSYQVLDPGDPGVLAIAGIDANLPRLVTEYLTPRV